MKKIEISNFKAIRRLWYQVVLWSVLYVGHYYEQNLLIVLCFWEITIATLMFLCPFILKPKDLPYEIIPKWIDLFLVGNEIVFIAALAFTGNVITACFVLIGLASWRITKARIKEAYEE